MLLFVFISQRPLTDLGLTLTFLVNGADWVRISVAVVFCGCVGVPMAMSIDLIDRDTAGSAWAAFKLRWDTVWTETPYNQPYFFALLFGLVALPQEFFFRGALQQLMHMWIDMRHDMLAFTRTAAPVSSSALTAATSKSVCCVVSMLLLFFAS